MDLWRGSLANFLDATADGSLLGSLSGNFVQQYGHQPSPAEFRSWQNSLPALGHALRDLGREDIGIALDGASQVAERGLCDIRDIGVTGEFHLPLSHKRIDVLLCGRGEDSERRALVTELKQWSSVTVEDEDAQNVFAAGREAVHPSEQAARYRDFLAEYASLGVDDGVDIAACAYLHNMPIGSDASLRGAKFADWLDTAPLFVAGQEYELRAHVRRSVGAGDGLEILDRVASTRFRPPRGVLQRLETVLHADTRWHLLDDQALAYNAILGEVRRMRRTKGRSVIVVRGAPGTGKTVIAVQLLATALRCGWNAAHSTGGKAFTTALRSRFRGADKLFRWNLDLRRAPFQGLDLLLVDEAHRVRDTSDLRWTPKAERGRKSQAQELIDAARVTVFLLDENQFVRPDEVGRSQLFADVARDLRANHRHYELATQFRCGGCIDYVSFVDGLLDFAPAGDRAFAERYCFDVVDDVTELDDLLTAATTRGESARIVAGFCWTWSNPLADGGLVADVQVGNWARAWNAKPDPKKRYKPDQHPYTLWAETERGLAEVGCIYSAQGFEFDRVGVIWGSDLVWRDGAWVAQREHSHDKPVRNSSRMPALVRNAYRVLLTRGIRETRVLCLDAETRDHLRRSLRSLR